MSTQPAPWRGRDVVYRCYDVGGALLYIGTSRDLPRRMDAHRHHSFWHSQVSKVHVQLANDELHARRLEAAAIQAENPRFNLQHRPPRRTWNEQDFRDTIRALSAGPLTEHRRRRIAALRLELSYRAEGLA